MHSLLLRDEGFYQELVNMRTPASLKPPPKISEQIQFPLNGLVSIAALQQPRCKSTKMKLQRVALNLSFWQKLIRHLSPPFSGFSHVREDRRIMPNAIRA